MTPSAGHAISFRERWSAVIIAAVHMIPIGGIIGLLTSYWSDYEWVSAVLSDATHVPFLGSDSMSLTMVEGQHNKEVDDKSVTVHLRMSNVFSCPRLVSSALSQNSIGLLIRPWFVGPSKGFVAIWIPVGLSSGFSP